jgi:hypothetical protein
MDGGFPVWRDGVSLCGGIGRWSFLTGLFGHDVSAILVLDDSSWCGGFGSYISEDTVITGARAIDGGRARVGNKSLPPWLSAGRSRTVCGIKGGDETVRVSEGIGESGGGRTGWGARGRVVVVDVLKVVGTRRGRRWVVSDQRLILLLVIVVIMVVTFERGLELVVEWSISRIHRGA